MSNRKMVVKAKILGISTTKNRSTDKSIKWDKMPYDFCDMDSGVKGGVVICRYADTMKVFIKCPQCGGVSFSSTHNVTFEDGFVNVTPSIDMNCCSWHGYLKNNEFKA